MDLDVCFTLDEIKQMNTPLKKIYIDKVMGDNSECRQIVKSATELSILAQEAVKENISGIDNTLHHWETTHVNFRGKINKIGDQHCLYTKLHRKRADR